MTTIWAWALLVSLLLVLFWAVLISWTRLQRLHRLHRRTDAARAGLDAALSRRADVALAVAGTLSGALDDPAADSAAAAEALRAAASAARDAGRPGLSGSDRESEENVLGRRLAGVDRARLPGPVRLELSDAEQLVILARTVHNDAVRDTLALRSRRLVRWLQLAGTAPLPAYFEIADAAPDVGVRRPEVTDKTSVRRPS